MNSQRNIDPGRKLVIAVFIITIISLIIETLLYNLAYGFGKNIEQLIKISSYLYLMYFFYNGKKIAKYLFSSFYIINGYLTYNSSIGLLKFTNLGFVLLVIAILNFILTFFIHITEDMSEFLSFQNSRKITKMVIPVFMYISMTVYLLVISFWFFDNNYDTAKIIEQDEKKINALHYNLAEEGLNGFQVEIFDFALKEHINKIISRYKLSKKQISTLNSIKIFIAYEDGDFKSLRPVDYAIKHKEIDNEIDEALTTQEKSIISKFKLLELAIWKPKIDKEIFDMKKYWFDDYFVVENKKLEYNYEYHFYPDSSLKRFKFNTKDYSTNLLLTYENTVRNNKFLPVKFNIMFKQYFFSKNIEMKIEYWPVKGIFLPLHLTYAIPDAQPGKISTNRYKFKYSKVVMGDEEDRDFDQDSIMNMIVDQLKIKREF